LKPTFSYIKTAIFSAVFFSILPFSAGVVSAQSLDILDQQVAGVISRIADNVVTVEARLPESKMPLYTPQCPGCSAPVSAMLGSGLLIDSIGHILTTLGLVDGSDNFRVEVKGNEYAARLVGIDQRHNLALLKINNVFRSWLGPSPLPPFSGRLAIAYGHSYGRTGYPSLGIVAGPQSDGNFLISGAILPGLPGGGVFDLSGHIIGIIISGTFAGGSGDGNNWGGMVMMPITDALSAADKMICCGDREAGYLGIKTTDIEMISDSGQSMGDAVVVVEVEPNSPAAVAGLRAGDIITRFGPKKISDDRELQFMVATAGAGNKVDIELIRGSQHQTISVPLKSSTVRPAMASNMSVPAPGTRAASAAPRMQSKVDSIRAEIYRMQKQLEILLEKLESTR
jgi:serine protease Do